MYFSLFFRLCVFGNSLHVFVHAMSSPFSSPTYSEVREKQLEKKEKMCHKVI